MKYFLDSAIVDEVRYALDMWNIDGITTNPKHVQASGKPFLSVIQEIGELVKDTDKSVSVQTNPYNHADYKAIVAEGRKLAKLSPNFVIKMPSTEHGFKACQVLTDEGIRTNLTLCFSPTQALQAMRMGAYYVSLFIGWKEANGEESSEFVENCVTIRDNYGFQSEILVAAVRNGYQIAEAAVCAADIVTTGYSVYKESFEHPYTDKGSVLFQGFWDKTIYE